MKRNRLVFYGLLTVVSAQFAAVGVLKLVQFQPLYFQLAELHISPGLGLGIGILEVLGVFGLWIRSTRAAALLGLLLLAICAVAVHFGAGVELSKAAPALFSTLVLTTLVYLNNPVSAKNLIRSPSPNNFL